MFRFRRVVVDEADRRVRDQPRALHLLHDQPAGIAGADDDHLLAARDDAEARPFHHGARQQARAGDERERDQQVHDRDRARQAHVVHRRDEVDGHVGDERRDDDAARRAPHVAHRDVAPPAAVEAEHDEDRELDRDDDEDRPPQQRVVVDRQSLVEAELEREHPRHGDDRRVRQQLQQAVATDSAHAACDGADRGADGVHHPLLRLDRDPRPERHGEVLRRDALGLRQRAGLVAEEAERRLQVQRRRVVGRGGDARLGERGADAVALRRAADEEVVDVAGLVLRQLDELAEAELGVACGRLAAAAVPARRRCVRKSRRNAAWSSSRREL